MHHSTAVCRAAGVRNLRIDHRRADPCDHARMESTVDISLYRCAIVLCDINWMDPDKVVQCAVVCVLPQTCSYARPFPQIATNGIEMHRSHDMMRMDSIILSIQLTIRRMLTQQDLPEINIICERMSKAVHLTRYEDQVAPVPTPMWGCPLQVMLLLRFACQWASASTWRPTAPSC